MNKDTLEGDWKQLTGKIKQKWGMLTDDDMTQAEGNREYLVGKLQEHYGLSKDMAQQNLRDIGYGD